MSVALLLGVPAGSQRHHPQFALGTGVMEGHHTQIGSFGRTQNNYMTGCRDKKKSPDKTQASSTEMQDVELKPFASSSSSSSSGYGFLKDTLSGTNRCLSAYIKKINKSGTISLILPNPTSTV